MNNNGYEPKEITKINREFVEELIYENMKLTNKNYRLSFDNERLRKRVEQLEKANRRLTQAVLAEEAFEQIVIVIKRKGYKSDN